MRLRAQPCWIVREAEGDLVAVEWRAVPPPSHRAEETSGGDSPPMQHPREALPRKKENRQPKRGIGEEDRVHTCTSRILEG